MVVCSFVIFRLAIVLSVLRFTDFDYPFGIFKLFVPTCSDTSLNTLLNVTFSSLDILIPHVQINYSISRVHVCFRRVIDLYFVIHT
jgi:hypothetical protein